MTFLFSNDASNRDDSVLPPLSVTLANFLAFIYTFGGLGVICVFTSCPLFSSVIVLKLVSHCVARYWTVMDEMPSSFDSTFVVKAWQQIFIPSFPFSSLAIHIRCGHERRVAALLSSIVPLSLSLRCVSLFFDDDVLHLMRDLHDLH